jgi:hypothetical protein
MNLVEQAIINTFPDTDAARLNGEMELREIPLWDSMNAINLLAEIERLSGCSGLQIQFSENITVSEITEMLRSKGVKI